MGIRGIVQNSWVEGGLFDCDLRSCGELPCCLAAESSGDEVLVSDSRQIDHELGTDTTSLLANSSSVSDSLVRLWKYVSNQYELAGETCR